MSLSVYTNELAKPQPLGPLTQLGVQKGDTVNVTAYGLYPQAQTQSFWFSFVTFLANLVGQQPPQPTGVGADPSRGRRNLPLLQVGVSTGLASLTQLGNGVPKGYLRVLVFDQDSVLVEQRTVQLTQAALQRYESLQVQLVLPQDGYVTAYVGNEGNVDVFFDDVTVEHRQGMQVQEVQYDPAGLELAGLAAPSPGIGDQNKGLTDILYNYLNLPRQIRFDTGADSVVFRYTASRQKVARLVYQTGKAPQRTDYLGAFQYVSTCWGRQEATPTQSPPPDGARRFVPGKACSFFGSAACSLYGYISERPAASNDPLALPPCPLLFLRPGCWAC